MRAGDRQSGIFTLMSSKPTTPPPIRLVAWAEPGQTPLLREAVEDGTLALAAVGSPDTADGT